MDSETITTFFQNLKRVYSDGIKNSVNQKAPIYRMLKDAGGDVTIGGEGLFWDARLGRSAQAAFIAEGAALAPGTTSREFQGSVTSQEIYAQIELTKKLMNRAKTDQDSFVRAFAKKADEARLSLQEQLGRAIVGNVNPTLGAGVTGVIGQVGAYGAPTVTMSNGFAGQLREQMMISWGAVGGTATGSGTVTTVTGVTTFTVAVVAGIPPAANDYIWAGSATFNSYNQEWVGLYQIVANSGTLFGINPAVYPAWTAFVDTQGGIATPFQDERLDSLLYGIEARSGKYATIIAMHYSTRLEMKAKMQQDVRYEPQVFRGGFKGNLQVWNNGDVDVAITQDNFVHPGDIFAICGEDIKIGKSADMGWLDDEVGGKFIRKTGTATYEAGYGCDGNMVCFQRNSHGLLRNVDYDANTVQFAS